METTKEELKNLFVRTLKISKKVRLNHRPTGVKFNEDKAVVRLDIDSYNGFSVGDLCIRKYIGWYCNLPAEPKSNKLRIAAFIELTAHLKGGGGIGIKDMFCVLARKFRSGGNGGGYYEIWDTHSIISHGTFILLFSVNELEKVDE